MEKLWECKKFIYIDVKIDKWMAVSIVKNRDIMLEIALIKTTEMIIDIGVIIIVVMGIKEEMEWTVKTKDLIGEVEADPMEEEDKGIKDQEADLILHVNAIMEDHQEDMKVENIHVQDLILVLVQMVKI